MKRINDLFQEKGIQIVALTNFAQIALEAFHVAYTEPESGLGRRFATMSSKLPEHYLAGRHIQEPTYKVVSFILSQSLIAMISEVEAFMQDAMIAVLCKHPGKLGDASIDIKKLTDLGSVEAAVLFAAEEYAHRMMYKNPNDYKKELLRIIAADTSLFSDTWGTYIEAKARRDIGVHNSWKVNDIYRMKIRGAGLPEPTEKELSVDLPYFKKVEEASIGLMLAVKTHCEKQFPEPA